MTITISNLTISNNAPPGTTIGVLTAQDASGTAIPYNYTLTKGSIGYFTIVGNNLVSAWSAPAMSGYSSIRVRAIGSSGKFSGSARFTINVVMAAPPPPPPPVITITPNTPEVPDTTPLGAVVATYTVVMSDGSPFSGTVQFGAPFFDAGGIFALSGNNIIVNPNGPGIGPNLTTITDHITREAIQ